MRGQQAGGESGSGQTVVYAVVTVATRRESACFAQILAVGRVGNIAIANLHPGGQIRRRLTWAKPHPLQTLVRPKHF